MSLQRAGIRLAGSISISVYVQYATKRRNCLSLIVVAVTSVELSRDKPIGLIGVEEGVRAVSIGGYAERRVATRKKTLNLTLVAGNFTWQSVILT